MSKFMITSPPSNKIIYYVRYDTNSVVLFVLDIVYTIYIRIYLHITKYNIFQLL